VRCVADVLVACATKNGSTEQVAEAIVVAMRGAGTPVTARRPRTVRESVAGYGLIVLGAPLYSGRWHRDAHRFLKRHRGELAAVPVAVFGMRPRSDTPEVRVFQRWVLRLVGPSRSTLVMVGATAAP